MKPSQPDQPQFYAYNVEWYRIEEHICTQFTEHTVVYKKKSWDGKMKDTRARVRSWGSEWFRTREEAVALVRKRAEGDIVAANQRIDKAVAVLEKLKGE